MYGLLIKSKIALKIRNINFIRAEKVFLNLISTSLH
jgi:hypothetical protein